jgi:hypothetical protein
MDVNKKMNYECSENMYPHLNIITHLLVHIDQKKKIAAKITTKIASLNGD